MVDSGEEDIVLAKRKPQRVIVDDEDIEDLESAQKSKQVDPSPAKEEEKKSEVTKSPEKKEEKNAQKEKKQKPAEKQEKSAQKPSNGHSETKEKTEKSTENMKLSEKLKAQKEKQKQEVATKTPEKRKRSSSAASSSSSSGSSSSGSSSSGSGSSSSSGSSSDSSSEEEEEDEEKARRYKELMERKKQIEKKKRELMLKAKKKLDATGMTPEEKAQMLYQRQLQENQKIAKRLEDKRERERKKREQKEQRKKEKKEKRNTPKKEKKAKSSATKSVQKESKPIASYTNLEYLVEELAKRWNYALPAWPPKDFNYEPVLIENGFRAVPPERFRSEEEKVQNLAKVCELELYPGVFKDSQDTLHDLRPEEGKPSFANFRKMGLKKLQRLLFEAYKRQLTHLEQEAEPYDREIAEKNRRELEKKLKKLDSLLTEN